MKQRRRSKVMIRRKEIEERMKIKYSKEIEKEGR